MLASLPSNPALCPKVIFRTYFKVMKFTGEGTEYLNCRVLHSGDIYRAKPAEPLSYTTSLENTKEILQRLEIPGNFSEKTFKVSGVSEAIHQNVPLVDIMSHGRWRNLETPLIYTNKNKKSRLEVSRKVV